MSSTVQSPRRSQTSAPERTTSAPPKGPLQVGSVRLPLCFVALGIASLLVSVMGFVAFPELLSTYHYNQRIIALTHLITLGWICSVVMGAMYQLVPVALETTLASQRLARVHLLAHAVGVLGMVCMFWVWEVRWLAGFAAFFGMGVLMFVANLGRTLKTIPRWNVVAAAVAAALICLLSTVGFGLFLVATKIWPIAWFDPLAQMHAHAHLGVLGFFLNMIVGVSYKLIPMFTLSDLQNRHRAATSIVLLNAGIAATIPAMLLQSRWKIAAALIILSSFVLYGLELRAILRARKRRSLDWALRTFLTALGFLAPASLLGVVLAGPWLPLTGFTGQIETLYGVVALLGIVSLAILGMLYKIVPFLVWYASYSRAIGQHKVPALGDLYSAQWQAWSYWLYLAGLGGLAMAIVAAHPVGIRTAAALLVMSLAVFSANMGRILSHLVRPKLEPLNFAVTQPAHA